MKSIIFQPAIDALREHVALHEHNSLIAFKQEELDEGLRLAAIAYGLKVAAGLLENFEEGEEPRKLTGVL